MSGPVPVAEQGRYVVRDAHGNTLRVYAHNSPSEERLQTWRQAAEALGGELVAERRVTAANTEPPMRQRGRRGPKPGLPQVGGRRAGTPCTLIPVAGLAEKLRLAGIKPMRLAEKCDCRYNRIFRQCENDRYGADVLAAVRELAPGLLDD